MLHFPTKSLVYTSKKFRDEVTIASNSLFEILGPDAFQNSVFLDFRKVIYILCT